MDMEKLSFDVHPKEQQNQQIIMCNKIQTDYAKLLFP